MQNKIKRGLCLVIAFAMTLSLSACSGAKSMSEKNITATVAKVEKALRGFDSATLKTYVKSSTLSTILSLSKNHPQFGDLGRAMFEKLEIEVKSVNKKDMTVTLAVKNRDLSKIAEEFTKESLSGKDFIGYMQLLGNDTFLNTSLSKLTAQISEATVPDNPAEVTVKIEKGENNLILNFDEKAENAVSGGAFNAVKNNLKSQS